MAKLSEKSIKTITVSVIFFCSSLLIVAAYFLISSGIFNGNSNLEHVSDEYMADKRLDYYNYAHDLMQKNLSREDFSNSLSSYIESQSSPVVKKSLKLYSALFFIQSNYDLDAANILDEVVKENDFSINDICELREFKQIFNGYKLQRGESAPIIDESLRIESCELAKLESANQKQENESDFEFAKRMYFGGLFIYGAQLLENLDVDSLTSEQKVQTYAWLLDYYDLTENQDKISETRKNLYYANNGKKYEYK